MTKTPINVRPLNSSDLDQIAEWFTDFNDVALFEGDFPIPVSKEQIVQSWKSSFEYNDPPTVLWYVFELDDKSIIGITGLQKINYVHGDAIIPMFLNKEFRKKGLAYALVKVMLDIGFGKLRLHRISTAYREDHTNTEAIIKKCGFVEEGRTREGWFADFKRRDIINVGILGSEWIDNRKAMDERLAALPFTINNFEF